MKFIRVALLMALAISGHASCSSASAQEPTPTWKECPVGLVDPGLYLSSTNSTVWDCVHTTTSQPNLRAIVPFSLYSACLVPSGEWRATFYSEMDFKGESFTLDDQKTTCISRAEWGRWDVKSVLIEGLYQEATPDPPPSWWQFKLFLPITQTGSIGCEAHCTQIGNVCTCGSLPLDQEPTPDPVDTPGPIPRLEDLNNIFLPSLNRDRCPVGFRWSEEIQRCLR